MSSIDEIRNTRIEKLNLLKKKGINPYPSVSNREISLLEAKKDFEELVNSKEEKWLAGRIMSLRGQGAIIFITLYDGTDEFQALFKKDILDNDKFETFNETIDIGDFIEVKGNFFITKRGEKTIEAKDWRILSKSLRPLPEKWHGLQDPEERFRKRYLDILMDKETKEIFEKKEKFWDVVRDFMKTRNFLEVETPSLEITTGGAEARPFKTHHNDFDMDVYLRISVGELWQKRLMAAGFPRVFEIGRVFRNEGSSMEHLQEFTNMEFYAAFMNLDEGKKITRDLFIEIARKVFNKTGFESKGHKFDLAEDWIEIDYVSEIKKQTGVDVLEDSEEKMMETLKKLKVDFEGKNRERLTDSLWKYCRKNISGPAYLINHPKLVAPLSKENIEDKRKTEMFQVIIAGSEMCRCHAELNDPVDQKERFEIQKELIEKGDEEAMMPDMEFVEMLEYGMPPAFGFGFGERFFATLLGKPIRETQLFPLMKPKKE